MNNIPAIGDVPLQQRSAIVCQLMVRMAQRTDIGAEITEDEHGVLIYIPKLT